MPLHIIATPKGGHPRPRALPNDEGGRTYAAALVATGQWTIQYPSMGGQLAVAVGHVDRAIGALRSALDLATPDETDAIQRAIAALESAATQCSTLATQAKEER